MKKIDIIESKTIIEHVDNDSFEGEYVVGKNAQFTLAIVSKRASNIDVRVRLADRGSHAQIVGFIVGTINTQFFRESKRADFILVFAFSIFASLCHYLIVAIISNSMALDLWDFFISSVMPTAIYTGLVSIPICVKLLDIYNLKEAEDYL